MNPSAQQIIMIDHQTKYKKRPEAFEIIVVFYLIDETSKRKVNDWQL